MKTRTKKPSPRERLEAIYERLPRVRCEKKCAAYCGPISMSGLELVRVEGKLGAPFRPRADGYCGALTGGGECAVYSVRPLICRMWGALMGMECPHGCEAERLLTKKEGEALLGEVSELSKDCGFDEDEPFERLLVAMKMALGGK